MIKEEFANHDCDVQTKRDLVMDILWFGESRLGKNGRKVLFAKSKDGIWLELIVHGEEEAEMIPYLPSRDFEHSRDHSKDEQNPLRTLDPLISTHAYSK